MSGSIPPLPNTPSWRGVQFKKKHRDNFTLIYRVRTSVRRSATLNENFRDFSQSLHTSAEIVI